MKNLICFVFMMLITMSSFSATLVVDQFNGPYYTINAAYNAAVDGDIVLICPATYLERVYISKAITLEGVDQNSTIIQSNNDYAIKISNGDVTISNLKIICSAEGIEVDTSTPTIEKCIIEQSGSGIYAHEKSFNLINCIIRNCSNGLKYDGTNSGTISGSIINNLIHDCSNGIYATHGGSPSLTLNLDIYSNIIINCTYGIRRFDYIYYNGPIAYNCFFNNSTNWSSGISISSGNITEQDPLFYDLNEFNYYLQSGSPCIDTGNPGVVYEDLDGTRNDMGIFGGPLQWGSGNPIVLDIQLTPESVTPGITFDIEATGQIK